MPPTTVAALVMLTSRTSRSHRIQSRLRLGSIMLSMVTQGRWERGGLAALRGMGRAVVVVVSVVAVSVVAVASLVVVVLVVHTLAPPLAPPLAPVPLTPPPPTPPHRSSALQEAR